MRFTPRRILSCDFSLGRINNRVQQLPVEALAAPAAEAMCSDLLSSGPMAGGTADWRKKTASNLAERFDRHPVWLTLAVHVLETQGDLAKVPVTAAALADRYLDEVVHSERAADSEQIRSLLRGVALLGTVNRQEEAPIGLLTVLTGMGGPDTVRESLRSLVARRALVERGARNRLVEIRPDVLRDHVLLNWLTINVGYGEAPVQPSQQARTLVASALEAVLAGDMTPLSRTVLKSLARIELLLRVSGQSVPLLESFFVGLRNALPTPRLRSGSSSPRPLRMLRMSGRLIR